MLGAIIGDIVGSRFEFNNTNKTDFELFTPECSFTDDTICTIAIADAILKGNRHYKESLHEWCNRYPYPKGGYGGSFAKWVHSDNPQPYNSYGNGSAMRVSPIGWAFDEVARTYVEAGLSAEPTHDHPDGMKGARCIADLIFWLRTKQLNKDQVKEWIEDHYGYIIPEFTHIQRNQFDETCQGTIPQAISCFLKSDSFEETIRLAVSIGGDSDTIAAIAGSIAEAYYGVPTPIWEQAVAYLPSEMKLVIEKFHLKYHHLLTE